MTDLKTLPVWISYGTWGKDVTSWKQTQLRQNHPFRATDSKWHTQVCLPWPQKRRSQMSAICRWSSETSVWLLPSIYQPACWSMQPQTGITKIKNKKPVQMIKTLIFSFLTVHYNILYWISDTDYLGSFPLLTCFLRNNYSISCPDLIY